MIDSMLSHYRIVAELGRGGMGIVYKAQDTKLDREVAIKVLPANALASDDDRARFHREAKAAAALNHPHIAAIYEIDQADGEHPFIAMEFIDGETLDARVKKGPLKLKDAVGIVQQMASALGAAHEKGIVHRDIKSANIMITSKDVVKVLDFGLAQTSASTKLTRMGSTLGTVAYMSPEQARGEEVDARTDLWALGVTFYELVAGRNPFHGDYEQAVVYAILNTEPEPLTAVRTGVPMELERIVNKLLSKQKEYRYQSAADLLADLKAMDVRGSGLSQPSMPAYTGVAPTPLSGPEGGAASRSRRAPVMLALGVLLGLVLTTAAFLALSGTPPPATKTVVAQINLPSGMTLEPGRSAPLALHRKGIALSPDGNTLVVVGSWGETTALYRRDMASTVFDRIPGTEDAYGVTFSPDGLRVAFYANNRLKTMRLDGGSPRDIADVSLPYGLVWLPDDRLMFLNAEGGRLEVVPASGGESRVMDIRLRDDPSISLTRGFDPIDLLPNGHVLGETETGIFELDPADGTAQPIPIATAFAVMGADGTLVYQDGKGLSVVPFDVTAAAPHGPAVTLSDSLLSFRSAQSHVATDNHGNLVYVRGADLRRTKLAWLDVDTGQVEDIADFAPEAFNAFRIAPDGRSVAISVGGISSDEIWNYNLERGTRTMVSAGGFNNTPVWSPDGLNIQYGSALAAGTAVLGVSAGGLSAPDTLLGPGRAPEWMTPDASILGVIYLTGRQWGLGYVHLDDPDTVLSIADQPDVTQVLSRLSRQGDRVAYTSNASGDYQVYVQPFPPTGQVWQISVGGGEEPVWALDDSAIFYRNGNELFRVDVTESVDGPTFSRPESVFRGAFQNVGGYSYDLSPIDGRFLVLRTAAEERPITRLEVILNYPALLQP
jgi:Tol biopolymer transport system component/predicted Ser/Thr protein kinase